MLIREFEAGDLPALQRIRQIAFAPIFQSFRAIVGQAIGETAFSCADAEQAKLLSDICAMQSRYTVLVAVFDREIAGFVSYAVDDATRVGEIGLNAVDPSHAGKGIGTALYLHALARMKEAGMAVATVSTGADPSHAPARRAYSKAGFGHALPSMSLYRLL